MNESSRGSLPPKLYFRIGEVAGLVGVEPHVLRYWEREFRSIRPSKSAKGQRVYSRRDVENLMRVRELLYGRGFTIAGAKKQLRDKGLEPEPDQVDAEAGDGAAMESASKHMRAELEILKAEVEAFLRELSTET
jgi:DNA-binding transcriptional MerR regulator